MPTKRNAPTYIRAWREHRGLTLERLAARLDVSHTTLSRVERGVTAYTQGMLEALAGALDVEPWQLLADDPTKGDGEVVDLLRHLPREQHQVAAALLKALISAGSKT